MSHVAWAAERSGEAPDALTRRLGEVFAAHPEWEALARVEAFGLAAEWLTRRVLDSETTRSVALDLLAADACVTFAFEAAADEPRRLDALAAAAQIRMAALVHRSS